MYSANLLLISLMYSFIILVISSLNDGISFIFCCISSVNTISTVIILSLALTIACLIYLLLFFYVLSIDIY